MVGVAVAVIGIACGAEPGAKFAGPERTAPVRLTVAGDYVAFSAAEGRFPIAVDGSVTPFVVSEDEPAGVRRVLELVQRDVEVVAGVAPDVSFDDRPEAAEVVIVGTVGVSPVIDQVVASGALDVSDLEGRWETFVTEVVADPLPGVDRALVIAGSDKRGTIYGLFDLTTQMGVSPWYFWADVPIAERSEVYVRPGRYSAGEPKVKYRGIFLNDEAPSLENWATLNFGGFNHSFYEHVFELLLRLRGNYLWPAMWGKAFADDDPANAQLADEYGIVMGTSHHEPMMRAQVEWSRFGEGAWDYESNAAALREFWRAGIERMGDRESIVIRLARSRQRHAA